MKRDESIAGLRFITAFLIAYVLHYGLLFHSGPQDGWILSTIFSVCGSAYIYASDLFLVVSGFLCFQSEKKYLAGNINVFSFLMKKIKKIYPLLLITVLTCFILEHVGLALNGSYPLHEDGGDVRYSFLSLLANLLLVNCGIFTDGDAMSVNGPSWFLSIYLFCTLIYIRTLKLQQKYGGENQKLRYLFYGALVLLGLLILCKNVNFPFLYSCNDRGYIFFFGGILMGKLLEWMNDRFGKNVLKWISLPVFILMILILCYSYHIGDRSKLPILLLWPLQVYLALYCPPVRSFLSIRFFQKLNRYDMAVFLCNLPFLTLIALLNQCFHWNIDYNSKIVIIVIGITGVIFSILVEKLTRIKWKEKM